MEGTVLCAANHAPLTPISFLERTALVYPDRPAVVAAGHAAAQPPPRTWRETRDRCLRLAAALAGLGVARRDVVSFRPLPSSPLFFFRATPRPTQR
jgi:fatty-acyl-CoA synthase